MNATVLSSPRRGDLGGRTIAQLDPRVAILNFGSLRSPVDVHELQLAHPQTRLIVLANHPSPAECNQMLAFGATACLSKETQARDILSAIHPRLARPARAAQDRA